MDILITKKGAKVNQKLVGLWLTAEEFSAIERLAKQHKTSRSSVARDLKRAALAEYQKSNKQYFA